MLDPTPAIPYAADEARIVPLHNPRQAAALTRAVFAMRDPGFTLAGGGVRTLNGGR